MVFRSRENVASIDGGSSMVKPNGSSSDPHSEEIANS